MYCVKVLSKLSDRLDAEFYNLKAIETIELMEKNGKTVELGEIIKEGYRVVYHGTDSINGLKATEVLPFLSPTQIGIDGDIDFDRVDHLPLYYRDDYPKGLASKGELLIEVKGNVSKVGIVPSTFPKNLMISGSLYKAKLNEDRMDPHYVLVFLKSKFGQILKDRLTSNTIINYIAKDALYSIPVFEASYTVQKYIGDKVRQAEALKKFSNSVFFKIREYFDAKIPDFKNEKKCYKLNSNDLEDRLDAQYYKDKYLILRDFFNANLSKSKKLGDFVLEALSGPTIPSSAFNSDNRGISILQTKDVRENYIAYDKCVKVDEKLAESFLRFKVGQNTLVMGMSGTVGRTALITSEIDSYILNQRVAGLKLKNNRFSGYLCAFLNHTFGAMQLERQTVGGVQANISLDDILNINIFIGETEAEPINQKFLEASLASELSKKLIKSSTMIVEGLVGGFFAENELIQAKNALEQGDTSLDRAILSQMTEDGYAVTGSKPLFADLDEFYDLLEQAKALE